MWFNCENLVLIWIVYLLVVLYIVFDKELFKLIRLLKDGVRNMFFLLSVIVCSFLIFILFFIFIIKILIFVLCSGCVVLLRVCVFGVIVCFLLVNKIKILGIFCCVILLELKIDWVSFKVLLMWVILCLWGKLFIRLLKEVSVFFLFSLIVVVVKLL